MGEAILSRAYVNVSKTHELVKAVETLGLQMLAYSCSEVLEVNINQSHVY